MSQEWDYPPRRKWLEEKIVRPSERPRFDRMIDHSPRSKNAWQWYRKQMAGGGSILYKLIITMLAFTALLFIGSVAAVCAIVLQVIVTGH